MRKLFVLCIAFLCSYVNAQNINDVVRFSTEDIQGTARFQSMAGAFGAVGGDLSSLNINPAGAAIFNYSEFTITGTTSNRDNDALFGNNSLNTDRNTSDINQAGAVFVFKSTNESPWRKISIGANYDIATNFDNRFFASGTTNQGIDNYFLNFAQGQALGNLRVQTDLGERIDDAYLDIGRSLGFGAQQAFLGFQSGILSPIEDTDENTSFVSNAQFSSLNQTYAQSTNGLNSKFNFTLAGQYKKNLYLGASLNFHNIFFEKLSTITETGFDADSEIQSTSFNNFLQTEGSAFSFSLGAIAKLTNNIRIGGSYQSPTWFTLTDNISQSINTDSPVANVDLNLIDFSLVSFFERYRIKSPSKLTGSAAIIFGKRGLLSFDYGFQDFSRAELGPTNDPIFAVENDIISEQLGIVNTFRIGGEYRIKQISLRAGYRFEESPYIDETIVGNLTGYSGGVGYSFGPNRIDLTYNRTEQDSTELFFDSGLSNAALVSRTNNNLSLGYSLKF